MSRMRIIDCALEMRADLQPGETMRRHLIDMTEKNRNPTDSTSTGPSCLGSNVHHRITTHKSGNILIQSREILLQSNCHSRIDWCRVSANVLSSIARRRSSIVSTSRHFAGGGRCPGADGSSRAWRIVCTETPAASAISAWLMQPATRSVAVLKSMAPVHVGIDLRPQVYYIIYQQGEKQGCRTILRRCWPTALPQTTRRRPAHQE